MSLWLVRAGRYGEQEEKALEYHVATIGWNDLPDLSKIKSKEELTDLYAKVYPEHKHKKMKAANQVGQIWKFISEIQKGDRVALPLKTQSAIVIGEVEGDYECKKLTNNIKHIRGVNWLKTIPRSSFDQDILYSLGSLMTVCQIKRNDAENRIEKILGKEKITEVSEKPEIDIERHAKDQIVKHIETKFKGHNLARLVGAILRAQGYITKQSPSGPDGGVDILAAAGPLGFDKPRVCAQVKSSSSSVGATVVSELRGVMQKVDADHGLLVSWGGFTNRAKKDARDAFFSIRLWEQDALLEEIFKYYEKFSNELKAELPLKRMWGLVVEEE